MSAEQRPSNDLVSQAKQFAATDLERSLADKVQSLQHRVAWAWSIIANVSGGDWNKQPAEWREAADAWERDGDPYEGVAHEPTTVPASNTKLDRVQLLVELRNISSYEPEDAQRIIEAAADYIRRTAPEPPAAQFAECGCVMVPVPGGGFAAHHTYCRSISDRNRELESENARLRASQPPSSVSPDNVEARRLIAALADNGGMIDASEVAKTLRHMQAKIEKLERTTEPPAVPLPEYTNAIGDAGAEYLKSVGAYGRHPFTSGNFYWHKLWDVMCGAAVTKEAPPGYWRCHCGEAHSNKLARCPGEPSHDKSACQHDLLLLPNHTIAIDESSGVTAVCTVCHGRWQSMDICKPSPPGRSCDCAQLGGDHAIDCPALGAGDAGEKEGAQ